ncbi:MAG: beta-N-acetylhexosaminidase [Alistipes sp.]|nr:beta-N-acetylhexosaminidase [Alistipes sp.]
MTKTLLTILFAACTFATHAFSPVPLPASATAENGCFTLDRHCAITAETVQLQMLAEYLAEYIPTGLSGSEGKYINLRTDDSLPEEGYALLVAPQGITITGGGYGGVFNGIQTLLQMLPAEVYSKRLTLPVDIACTRVDDAPRFSYRGFSLDVARTWMDAARVKRYIDLLSYHKINKLHFHISDDEGWRIEIKSHPEFAQTGGFRGGDSPVAAVYGCYDRKYGGYYTQDEIRSIVRYAAARNIEIIPEIDLPGHSLTAARLHPEILCNYTPDTSASAGYDTRHTWCVAREENYELLSNILGEICELFPSHHIHIGGDEVDMSQWERCPDCRRLMQSRGMHKCEELEACFINRIIEILDSHGKSAAVWNEAAATGELARDARVHGWSSAEDCRRAAALGYSTVVMPGQYFYFDMRQSPSEEGHNWAGIFDVRKTYSFDLHEQGFTDEQIERIAGFEGAFFSETYLMNDPESPDYTDSKLFPRVCALSELAWCGKTGEWSHFYSRLIDKHYDRMSAMGIAFRLFTPEVTYADGAFTAKVDDGSHVYYRKDGDKKEHLLDGELRTASPQLYSFVSRRGRGVSNETGDKSRYRRLYPAFKLTSTMPESSRAPLSRVEKYAGIARSLRTCHDGDSLLYTFEQPFSCRSLLIRTGYEHVCKNIMTAGYVETSSDGINFTCAATLQNGFAEIMPKGRIKAVRVVCTQTGNASTFVVIQPPVIR